MKSKQVGWNLRCSALDEIKSTVPLSSGYHHTQCEILSWIRFIPPEKVGLVKKDLELYTILSLFLELVAGIEPATCSLRVNCSTDWATLAPTYSIVAKIYSFGNSFFIKFWKIIRHIMIFSCIYYVKGYFRRGIFFQKTNISADFNKTPVSVIL